MSIKLIVISNYFWLKTTLNSYYLHVELVLYISLYFYSNYFVSAKISIKL